MLRHCDRFGWNLCCVFNSITKTYFENLVKALENGLADVDTQGASSKSTNTKSSKTNGGGKGKGSSKSSGSSKNLDGNWGLSGFSYKFTIPLLDRSVVVKMLFDKSHNIDIINVQIGAYFFFLTCNTHTIKKIKYIKFNLKCFYLISHILYSYWNKTILILSLCLSFNFKILDLKFCGTTLVK